MRSGNFGGHGLWGGLCADCAALHENINRRWFSAGGTVLAHERKPGEEEPPTRPWKPDVKPKARVSKEDTAETVAAVVRDADAPITAADIAAAIGTERNNSSFRRALDYARDQRWIAVHEGRGWVTGDCRPLSLETRTPCAA